LRNVTNHNRRSSELTRLAGSPSRLFGNRLVGVALAIGTALAVTPLLLVVSHVLREGGSALSFDAFTKLPPPPGISGGGLGNAIVGTVVVVTIAAFISVVIGLSSALYLAEMERNPHIKRAIRFCVDVLAGIPSVITGVFVYGLLVASGLIGFSAFAGSVALALVMIPMVIRASEEALALVPMEYRFGATGLGAYRFQTLYKVILPAALPGITTGTLLAVARATGETAPLVFTAFYSQFWPNVDPLHPQSLLGEPIATLSVLIYNFSSQPFEAQQRLAWAASLLLLVSILGVNITVRKLLRRS
jgi:phosphate transport system permease protein